MKSLLSNIDILISSVDRQLKEQGDLIKTLDHNKDIVRLSQIGRKVSCLLDTRLELMKTKEGHTKGLSSIVVSPTDARITPPPRAVAIDAGTVQDVPSGNAAHP